MKKNMNSMADRIWALRGLLTVFCVAAVFWCVSFVSHADTVKGTITGSNVNVRETASTTAEAVATLSANDLVDVIAETTGDDDMKWYKITTESGVTGYVRSDLIKKATVTVDVTQTDSKTAYIAGSNANIRQDASTSSGRVANALGGSKVTIIGEATGADGYKWYQIEFSGNGNTMTGFIRSDLVTFEAPAQDPEITEIEGEMGEGSEPESTTEPVSEEESSESEEPSESEETSESDVVSIPLSGNEGTFVIMEPVSILETLPEGFEQTELQLGEEIYTVWGKGQFYIMYASVNDAEPQYYLYDAINKSFVAYTGLLSSEDVAASDEDEGINYKLIAIICIAVIVILAVVIGILAYKLSNAKYDNYDDDDDDDYDYESEDDFVDLTETANLAEVSESLESNMPVYEEAYTEYETEAAYEMPVDENVVAGSYEPSSVEMEYDAEAGVEYSEDDADMYSYIEDDSVYEEEDNEKTSSKKAKKEKKKFGQRLLDYFTVEVEEDDDDDEEEDDYYEKKRKKKVSVIKPEDDDDDDDLNFIDL